MEKRRKARRETEEKKRIGKFVYWYLDESRKMVAWRKNREKRRDVDQWA